MSRKRIVAGVILMGIFMCGLFTCQAFPLLSPIEAAQDYITALVFAGALITGFLLGMLTSSIAGGIFAGFFSIMLGLVLAGLMMSLPALLGVSGQLGMLSGAAVGRALILGAILTPIAAVGTFIGVLARNRII